MSSKGKIGVFDSGFGGLSILSEIIKKLPEYDYVYLGDTARAPYGSRSQEIIFEFTRQGIDFLFNNGANLVILACNTASSEALRKLQQEYIPKNFPKKKVLGVVIPGAEEAAQLTQNKCVAILGTEATVSSNAFLREIKKLNPDISVSQVAAPLLVPLIEAGEEKSESARLLIKQYVDEALKDGADTLVLGCTHYGLIEGEIKECVKGVTVISEGLVVAHKLQEYLNRHSEIESKLSKGGTVEFYTTDQSKKFDEHGSRFFGRGIQSKQVHI